VRFSRVSINSLFLIRLFRFRRALLIKVRSQNHEEEHLEKLAFPVLHSRLQKVIAAEIFNVSNRRLPVLLLVIVILEHSHDGLPQEKCEEEQTKEHERKPVVTKKALHPADPPRHYFGK
jgi:hypothetical protein